MATSDKSTLLSDSVMLDDNLTTDAESSAYTGIDKDQASTPYAKVADLNALRVAFENIRTDYEDLRAKLIEANVVEDYD